MTPDPADVERLPVVVEVVASTGIVSAGTARDTSWTDDGFAYSSGGAWGARAGVGFELSRGFRLGFQAGYQYLRFTGGGLGVSPRAHMAMGSLYLQYSFGPHIFRSGPRLGLGLFGLFDASPADDRFVRRGDFGGWTLDLAYCFALPLSSTFSLTSALGALHARGAADVPAGLLWQANVSLGAQYTF